MSLHKFFFRCFIILRIFNGDNNFEFPVDPFFKDTVCLLKMTATKSMKKFEFCSFVEDKGTQGALFVWVAEMSNDADTAV